MLKEDYKKIVTERPWTPISEHFDNLPITEVNKLTNLDINTEDWIQFTIDNFDQAQQNWEIPKPHYTESAKQWAEINNRLGRNEHNTFELNYGVNGDTNTKLKLLLGSENIQKLKADADTVLIRLLVKMPGHGVAWHYDSNGTYKRLFPDVDHSKLKRIWFSIQDWHDGHAFQISKTILSHWKKGDVWQIPFGIGHASTNFGYTPQYTVSMTAVIND